VLEIFAAKMNQPEVPSFVASGLGLWEEISRIQLFGLLFMSLCLFVVWVNQTFQIK
jgi:hypothetical protein